MPALSMSNQIYIHEMSPRDGLQVAQKDSAPLELRVRLVETLQRAGLAYIEVGSFVDYDRVPAMRGTGDLADRLSVTGDTPLGALVPNLKYYREFVKHPSLNVVAVFVSASETYSRKNVGRSVDAALREAASLSATAARDGYRVRAHLSGGFHDPIEAGRPSDITAVRKIASALVDAGCYLVSIADTDGRAGPCDMDRVIPQVCADIGSEKLGVHLHDRHGLGMVNAYRAFQLGVRNFDAAVGGIGGNRAVPGPVGNIATEELVYMLERIPDDKSLNTCLDTLVEAGKCVREIARVSGLVTASKLLADRLDAPPGLSSSRVVPLPAIEPRR